MQTRILADRRLSTAALAVAIACASPGFVPQGVAGASTQRPPVRTLAPDAILAARMRGHYVQALRVADAVVRGDLPAVREPAQALAAQVPERVPPLDSKYAAAMQQAATRAAQATDLATAAGAVASMLATCGECHRAAAVRPRASDPVPATEVGGIVGHMVAHQAAVDLLARGVIEPSSALWTDGATRLAGASLRPAEWPRDRQLRANVLQAERQVHALAARAREAASDTARTTVLAEVLATCASCHSLHPGVWGPR